MCRSSLWAGEAGWLDIHSLQGLGRQRHRKRGRCKQLVGTGGCLRQSLVGFKGLGFRATAALQACFPAQEKLIAKPPCHLWLGRGYPISAELLTYCWPEWKHAENCHCHLLWLLPQNRCAGVNTNGWAKYVVNLNSLSSAFGNQCQGLLVKDCEYCCLNRMVQLRGHTN